MRTKQLTPLSKLGVAHPYDGGEEGPDVDFGGLFRLVVVAGVYAGVKLGGHEGCCACYFEAGGGGPPFRVRGGGGGGGGGGEPEIGQGEVISAGRRRGVFPEDIFGVDVAVDDAVLVEVV